MSIVKNTFAQGMDQDSSKNKYDDSHYYDAQNIRVITQNGLSSGAIENVLGNVQRVNTVSSGNNYVIGHTLLRDYLILFTTDNNGIDRIWKVNMNTVDTLSGAGILNLSTTYYHSGGNLLYQNDLNFSTTNKIKAVSRWESDRVQKVYWVDGVNNLRHLNTVYNILTNDIDNLDPDKLEVISNFSVTRPEISGFGAGNLRSGKIQYIYQLYALNGNETTFSPTSHLINITASPESAVSSDGYQGSDLDVNTGKAVLGTIDITATGFNRIRIVAIHYTTLQGDPQIRLIDEKEISSDGETVTFIDSGQNLGSYTLEQIRTTGTYLFSAKNLLVKDNILFPLNITENQFDIDFDARAYRFAGESSVSTEANYQAITALRKKCKIFDASGNYYLGDGNFPAAGWNYYDSTDTADPSKNIVGWENIPEEFDAINRFNDIDNDGDHNYRFMYQTDGVTLGGEGPHIKYTFKIKTVELDDYSGIPYIKTGIETPPNIYNLSYYNYASPYQCARYLGYARDEVYRFGIVFFDTKGRNSFVKWIGDIRMPSISTEGSQILYNPDNGEGIMQRDELVFSNYSIGNSCRYEVYLDNELDPVGYGFSFDESSVDDVLSAVIEAVSEIPTHLSIISSDFNTGTLVIEYNYPGNHTITIRRYREENTHPYYVNYTNTTIITYSPESTGASYNFSPVFYDYISNKIKMNILYPEFTVDLIGTEAEGLTYQIVRVLRQSNDRSIKGQGLVTGIYKSTSNLYPYNLEQSTSWATDAVCFNSPEIAFNKNLISQYGDKLQIAGTLESTAGDADSTATTQRRKYIGILPLPDPQTPGASADAGDEFHSTNSVIVSKASIIPMDKVEEILGDYLYHTALKNSSGTDLNADKGINLATILGTTSWAGINDAATARSLVNYRRNVFLYQYGGPTNEARARNTYMAIGRVQNLNQAVISVFDGDTYIAMFDYLNAGWKLNSATGLSDIAIFPVETSINLELRMDECYHTDISDANVKLMRELKGTYTDDDGSDQYIQATDLYRYNTVYSKENTTKLYISRPFDWYSQSIYDTRILASEVKINNEYSDSWLNFKANAYIDVDPQYGELTALFNLNNQTVFFQPKAIGTVSINERALIQTQTISQLSLGITGVLERYDYVKTEVGASHPDHIILTQNGLYWVDMINKAMFKFSSGIEELSLMKGMQSWFRNNLSENTDITKILLFTDPYYKEVNVIDSSQNINLVYNEITDSFISRYTYYPIYVINFKDKVFSTNSGLRFYKHNDINAQRCSFYGNAPETSTITLIVNPQGGEICIFNNLEWLTEVYVSNDNTSDETFSTARITNDYQDTGLINLVIGNNIRRRVRTWRHVIQRARYDETGAAADRRDARIRDSYIKLELRYTNINNHKLIVHDITTSYMLSNK